MNTNSHARTKNGLDARLFGRLYDHKKSRTNLDLMPLKLGLRLVIKSDLESKSKSVIFALPDL